MPGETVTKWELGSGVCFRRNGGQWRWRGAAFILALFLAVLPLSGCGSGTPSSGKTYTVGVVQIISHVALDAARQGFVDGLKEEGFEEGKNLTLSLRNAEGSQDTARQIADKFVSDRVDLILAIATPAAQAAAQATKSSGIPVVVTAVTDPVAAGLVQSLEKPGTNVTGTTDMNPVEEQLALTLDVAKGKHVGILYNSGEVNSRVQVDIAKEAAKKLGLELFERTVTNTNEVQQAAEALAVQGVHAFYIPTDNTVVAGLASVLQVAEKHKIPVIAGEGDSVKNGALATYGIDYYSLGKQTAKMAAKILRGEAKPQDMPIERQKDLKFFLNLKAAEQMGVQVPEAWKKRANETY